MKKTIFITDIHFPHQNQKAIKLFLKVAKDIKPDILIYGGDNWDAEGVSKFTMKNSAEGLAETYIQMLNFKKEIFDKFKSELKPKEIYLMLGNHEQRIDDYLERCYGANLFELFRFWEQQFNYKKVFGCKVYKYNEILTIGKINFMHGEFHNKYHSASHIDAVLDNVMYGHLHTKQVFTKVTKKNKPYQAISVPCLCELNPKYMKNRGSAWINGFGLVYLFRNGTFHYEIKQFIDNTTVHNGKIYKL